MTAKRNIALWTIALGLSGAFAAVAQVQAPVLNGATEGAGTPLAVSGTADVSKILTIQADDRVQGKKDAPLTIIEYASMTCSHCRDFSQSTMPKIEEEWIDTGKANYVLRHLPWDNLALAEAMVMRCAPESSYYPLAKAFFGAQEAIMKAADPLSEVKQIARFAGLNDEAVQACITDPAGHDAVTNMRTVAQRDLGIKGTPTIFVNGDRIEGAESYEKMLPELQKAYKKATGK
ncbi:MAG TPA: DsbA family protein [Alphaproteobacteria bacterium]|nr:DsbA family protein [Alphaproteobacteria bacterium]